MIYLTYNDLPSGIYFSQVTDVCLFLEKQFGTPVKLIALISFRDFRKNKKKITEKLPNALVIPMIPKHSNWKLHFPVLKLLLRKFKNETLMCRGVFATNLGLMLKDSGKISKVIFDARGAYKYEFSEYLNKIVQIKDDVGELENKAILLSDQRLAISNKLVEYWKSEYSYSGNNHVIIPCCLSKSDDKNITLEALEALRKAAGYNSDDIIAIYSGSSADWQSLKYLDSFLVQHLNEFPKLKVILLSRFDQDKLESIKLFPDRVSQKWLAPSEVVNSLLIADYGLLLREYSITNKVASPTKFAEYLNAGLKVIISPSIGDFTEFVEHYDAGFIYQENKLTQLVSNDFSEKFRMRQLANDHFTKSSYSDEYKKLIF